jgi:hypothetical protein
MLYDAGGRCRTLVVDCDVAGPEGVQLVHRVVALVERCGGRVIVDRSPTGRHHVYVPLRGVGLSVEDASWLAKALAVRFPGVDPLPHLTGAVSGCIRPPGSPHKAGGHQELVTDLDTARQVLMVRNGTDVVAGLEAELAGEIAGVRRGAMHLATVPEEAPVLDAPFVGRVLSPRMADLAREGTWEASGYGSASEARMGVLCAAVRAGLSFTDVTARLADGRWAGLNALYANANQPGRLVGYEWRKASAYVTAHPEAGKRVRGCNTSAENVKSRGGRRAESSARASEDPGSTEHRFVRRWRAVLAEVETREFKGTRGLHARLMLRALAAAGHQTGSRHVSFGVRSLSLAMPADPSTVARVLQELREAQDPWIVLVREGEGTAADLYELRIPERHEDLVDRVMLAPGKVHAARPVFRELGAVAAVVFEAIEQGATTVQLAGVRAGVSRSAVYEVLEVLEAWGLVERDAAGALVARPEFLGPAAERIGAVVVVGLLVERFRVERRAWVEYLSRHAVREEWWEALVREGPPLRDPGWAPEDPGEQVVA